MRTVWQQQQRRDIPPLFIEDQKKSRTRRAALNGGVLAVAVCLVIYGGALKQIEDSYIRSYANAGWDHSALKLEKMQFQKYKNSFLTFQKWHKINFCTRKKFKTTKNAIFGLFSGAKIDFLPFLKMQIMLFCTFEIALFF